MKKNLVESLFFYLETSNSASHVLEVIRVIAKLLEKGEELAFKTKSNNPFVQHILENDQTYILIDLQYRSGLKVFDEISEIVDEYFM